MPGSRRRREDTRRSCSQAYRGRAGDSSRSVGRENTNQWRVGLGVRVLTHPFISTRHRADAEDAAAADAETDAETSPREYGPAGTVASRAAVPLCSQAAGASDGDAVRVIFVILSILSTLSPPVISKIGRDADSRDDARREERQTAKDKRQKTGWTGLTG